MQKITFDERTEWYSAIAAMVAHGITFHAYIDNRNYVIECTGGY